MHVGCEFCDAEPLGKDFGAEESEYWPLPISLLMERAPLLRQAYVSSSRLSPGGPSTTSSQVRTATPQGVCFPVFARGAASSAVGTVYSKSVALKVRAGSSTSGIDRRKRFFVRRWFSHLAAIMSRHASSSVVWTLLALGSHGSVVLKMSSK